MIAPKKTAFDQRKLKYISVDNKELKMQLLCHVLMKILQGQETICNIRVVLCFVLHWIFYCKNKQMPPK